MHISGTCTYEKQHKCIIGGGSSFIDALNLRLLETYSNRDICVIGCNRWGLLYKCDIGIMQDALFYPVTAFNLRNKVETLVLKDYELPILLRNKTDYLFEEGEDISETYNGVLYCGRTVAVGALQFALQLGYTDILCVGALDFTKRYSKDWYNNRINEWKEHEIKVIKDRIELLQRSFNAFIVSANKDNRVNLPYMDYYNFLEA